MWGRTGRRHQRNFYPRPPCGGRQVAIAMLLLRSTFLSTPSVRRATTPKLFSFQTDLISIHALRAEGDAGCDRRAPEVTYFYPRPPCGGRRAPAITSTRQVNFYPRPPCGGRLTCRPRSTSSSYFYPRPPCGGRQSSPDENCAAVPFLSTPSVRRATPVRGSEHPRHSISIHALRAEGDVYNRA